MRLKLQYGVSGLDVDVPFHDVTVLEPRFVEGLGDEEAGFRAAVRAPIDAPPLRDVVGADETVALVIPDITRPFPSSRVLPWVFEELAQVAAGRIVIVNGTGSHRANTPDELTSMVGAGTLGKYRVVNHDAYDPATLAPAGTSGAGRTVYMNRDYVEADRRILLGFIEPHFFAGYSGGYKAVFPGITDIDSIMHYHRADVIGDPRSTWGVLEGNPTQEQVRANGSLLPVDFCINVTLNSRHEITRFFCGDPITAHEQGCRYVKETAMVRCDSAFPVVVTTNGGYPLDQNLYQAVKGMSAADQVVAEGGLVVCAAECSDGFPEHGNFKRLLFDHDSPEALLNTVLAPGFSMFDQWEAQKLALIRVRARVALHSNLPPEDVTRAYMEPAPDLDAYLREQARQLGADAPVAVLPEGPMTIPYLA